MQYFFQQVRTLIMCGVISLKIYKNHLGTRSGKGRRVKCLRYKKIFNSLKVILQESPKLRYIPPKLTREITVLDPQ